MSIKYTAKSNYTYFSLCCR